MAEGKTAARVLPVGKKPIITTIDKVSSEIISESVLINALLKSASGAERPSGIRQYAFLEAPPENAVASRIRMSSRIDQLSM